MFTIDDNYNITLTRGDSLYTTVTMTEDGSTYTPEDGDVITFTMQQTYYDETVVLEKEIDTSTLVLYIAPDDTAELDFGSYVYAIRLTKSDGDVATFLKGKFIVEVGDMG